MRGDRRGPTLIEALTYRQKGHSRADPGAYRPPGELEAWLERDPITRCEAALRDMGVAAERLDDLRAQAAAPREPSRSSAPRRCRTPSRPSASSMRTPASAGAWGAA